jgi:hypothetical protein
VRLVVLLLLALLASGCTDDPGAPPAGPKPPVSEESPGPGTDAAEPPPPAASESEVLERVRRAVEAARAGDPIPDATAPTVQGLKQDYSRGGDCPAFYRSNGSWELCARGDTDGSRTLVVIGDSHARQWGSPIDILAAREGYAAYHLVRLGCPAADLTPWLNKGDGPNVVCEQFHAWTVEQVRALQPDIVVLATSFNPHGYVVDGVQVLDETERLRLLREGMARLVGLLEPDAGRFAVIGDPPAVQLSPVKCLLRAKTLDRCAAAGSALSLRATDAVRGAAQDAAATYVSTAEWFCLDNLCPTVLGELLSYRDQNHVSDTYARYLTEVLGQRLGLDAEP